MIIVNDMLLTFEIISEIQQTICSNAFVPIALFI